MTVERDPAYVTVDGAELCLDIYRPAEPGTPVVVYAHGRGWTRQTGSVQVASEVLG